MRPADRQFPRAKSNSCSHAYLEDFCHWHFATALLCNQLRNSTANAEFRTDSTLDKNYFNM